MKCHYSTIWYIKVSSKRRRHFFCLIINNFFLSLYVNIVNIRTNYRTYKATDVARNSIMSNIKLQTFACVWTSSRLERRSSSKPSFLRTSKTKSVARTTIRFPAKSATRKENVRAVWNHMNGYNFGQHRLLYCKPFLRSPYPKNEIPSRTAWYLEISYMRQTVRHTGSRGGRRQVRLPINDYCSIGLPARQCCRGRVSKSVVLKLDITVFL